MANSDKKVTFRPSSDCGIDYSTLATVYGLGCQQSGDGVVLGYFDQNVTFRPSSDRAIDFKTWATVYGLAIESIWGTSTKT